MLVMDSTLETPRYSPGGVRELFALAGPLILSAGFLTFQLCLDRIFLTWNGTDESAASMPAVMVFSTLFGFLNYTILYVSVFVSQYGGANRPHRIGPVLWQATRLAVLGGFAFLLLIPFSRPLFELFGHAPEVIEHEVGYFQALCWAALPTLLVGVIESFFTGRGKTWTVLAISAIGLIVNGPLAYAWVLGEWGFPKLGAAGAGYATVCGSVASLLVGLLLLLPKKYEREFRLHSGWRYDAELLKRLLRFGVPNGIMYFVDILAWTAFVLLVGTMSKVESAATNVAFTLNLLAFLPLNGLGQGVEVLVGKRQGESRPDLSARTTRNGMILALAYSVFISIIYVAIPGWLAFPFQYGADPEKWSEIAPLLQRLLLFVGLYTVGDSINIIVSFALRGAGDTRYVAWLSIGLAWPIMVIPTWIAAHFGQGVIGAWIFATIYIFILAIALGLRFLGGKWRSMKVIEPEVVVD